MPEDLTKLKGGIETGEIRSIARAITLVENNVGNYKDLLKSIRPKAIPVVGITGPPGAGKSSVVNSLIKILSAENKKVAVIAVDPSSPFNYGSLLGDRIRMEEHFLDPNVYIRSVATRGSLGGLSSKIIEITDVLKSANFDFVIIETVGVGQSEVEIAGLADTTVLVLVPEAGDEVQTIKSGIMEIADIFVVNKADREGAGHFVKNLLDLIKLNHSSEWVPSILKTVAIKGEGIKELLIEIEKHNQIVKSDSKKLHLFSEKAYRLIQEEKMKDITRQELTERLKKDMNLQDFNLYSFIESFAKSAN